MVNSHRVQGRPRKISFYCCKNQNMQHDHSYRLQGIIGPYTLCITHFHTWLVHLYSQQMYKCNCWVQKARRWPQSGLAFDEKMIQKMIQTEIDLGAIKYGNCDDHENVDQEFQMIPIDWLPCLGSTSTLLLKIDCQSWFGSICVSKRSLEENNSSWQESWQLLLQLLP